jgi:putative ABC transport system permease protein
VAGNPAQALQEPNTIVLSQPMARKIFGEANPLNAVLKLGDDDYKVTGVFEQPKKNSHIHTSFFTSLYSKGLGEYVNSTRDFVGGNFIYTYIKLHPDASAKALEAKLPPFLEKHAGDKIIEAGITESCFLQSGPDIHLYSTVAHEAGAGKLGTQSVRNLCSHYYSHALC